mgnify:CR=1 FL=1
MTDEMRGPKSQRLNPYASPRLQVLPSSSFTVPRSVAGIGWGVLACLTLSHAAFWLIVLTGPHRKGHEPITLYPVALWSQLLTPIACFGIGIVTHVVLRARRSPRLRVLRLWNMLLFALWVVEVYFLFMTN